MLWYVAAIAFATVFWLPADSAVINYIDTLFLSFFLALCGCLYAKRHSTKIMHNFDVY